MKDKVSNYLRLLKRLVFYDQTEVPRSYLSSNLTCAGLILRFFQIFSGLLISPLAWVVLRTLSLRYKVSIYILKPFRPGFASTYLGMMEPLCRDLEHNKHIKHLKILIDPGELINRTVTDSYYPNFSFYLDDRRKFFRLVTYCIPGWGLEKEIISPNNKFNVSWALPPSGLHTFEGKDTPDDLKNLGINPQTFVLIASPSRKYYQKRFDTKGQEQIPLRLLELSNYIPALENILDRNIKIVRVGLDADELPAELRTLPIIDFASEIRSEFSELWLHKNCRFMISISCGAYWFSRRFNRPSILTDNYTLDTFGYFSTLYTTRLVQNVETGELLSLRKLLNPRNLYSLGMPNLMKERGLQYIQNSPTVLVNAVNEMISLNNGLVKYSESDIQLLNRFYEIVKPDGFRNLEGYSQPSLSFLRDHPFLLE